MPLVCGLLHGGVPLEAPVPFCLVLSRVSWVHGGVPSSAVFFVFSRVWNSTTLSIAKPIAIWTQEHEWCGLALRIICVNLDVRTMVSPIS